MEEINEMRLMARLCEVLSDLAYCVHLKYLKRGDEVKAIEIFENLVLPFERLAKLYKTLERIKKRTKEEKIEVIRGD